MGLLLFLIAELAFQAFDGEPIGVQLTMWAIPLAAYGVWGGFRAWRELVRVHNDLKQTCSKVRYSLVRGKPCAIPILHITSFEVVVFLHTQGLCFYFFYFPIRDQLHIGFHVLALLSALVALHNDMRGRTIQTHDRMSDSHEGTSDALVGS
jgi:hypothetical protein